eukprot:5869494-Prymnesium_polylepis.1
MNALSAATKTGASWCFVYTSRAVRCTTSRICHVFASSTVNVRLTTPHDWNSNGLVAMHANACAIARARAETRASVSIAAGGPHIHGHGHGHGMGMTWT